MLARLIIEPFGVIATILPVVFLAAFGVRAYRQAAARAGVSDQCLNCGYRLIGNESGRCPECGIERRALESAARANSRLERRRFRLGSAALLTLIILLPEVPFIALGGFFVWAILWSLSLPRFSIDHCQVCGKGLCGAPDGECGECGARLGDDDQRVVSAEVKRLRRRACVCVFGALLLALAAVRAASFDYWIRAECFNRWLTVQDGRITYTTPAHEDYGALFDVSWGRKDSPGNPWMDDRGGYAPQLYYKYGAWHFTVPIWMMMIVSAVVVIAACRPMKPLESIPSSVRAKFVRVPSPVDHAKRFLVGLIFTFLAILTAAAVRGGCMSSVY